MIVLRWRPVLFGFSGVVANLYEEVEQMGGDRVGGSGRSAGDGGNGVEAELNPPKSGCPVYKYPSDAPRTLNLDPVLDAVRNSSGIARLEYPYGDLCWVVTGYDDVRAVYSKGSFSRSGMMHDAAPRLTAGLLLQGGIGSLDDGTHLKLRRAINAELSADRMKALRLSAESIMSNLVTPLEAAGGGDYANEVAKPFALAVLGELLDIPVADQAKVASWVASLLSDSSAADGAAQDAEESVKQLGKYVMTLVDSRRADPRGDLVSNFALRSELANWEVVTIVFSLIVGGFESSAHMMSKVVLRLVEMPDLWTQLHAQPDLIPDAVEELLRTISLAGGESIPWSVREKVRLGNVDILPGDYVMPAVGAANRDPRIFEEPEEIILGRSEKPHLSFGHGTRYCLGSQIARMELEVGIGALVKKYPHIELGVAEEDIRWRSGSAVWQLDELPIVIPSPLAPSAQAARDDSHVEGVIR